jgi:hypothetical protein
VDEIKKQLVGHTRGNRGQILGPGLLCAVFPVNGYTVATDTDINR